MLFCLDASPGLSGPDRFDLGATPRSPLDLFSVSMSSNVSSSSAAALPSVEPPTRRAGRSASESAGAAARVRAARALLDAAFGAAPRRAVGTGDAWGSVGVQADQTHYSDGFALLLGLSRGVAVAARRSRGPSRVAFAPDAVATPFDRTASLPHPGGEIVRRVVGGFHSGGETTASLELAVISTIPPVLGDAALSALAVATAEALLQHGATRPSPAPLPEAASGEALARHVTAGSGRPTGTGYALAARAGRPSALLLVDTALHEHLVVKEGGERSLRWAVLDPGVEASAGAAVHRQRAQEAREALDRLRDAGVADIDAFRDLEHRDLDRAVHVLPPSLHAITRHLVTENRRVQKHVAALRQGDGQMVGGLLRMSHASRRATVGAPAEAIEALVDDTESLTLDGTLYGAGAGSRNGAVLVTGRAPAFADGLARLTEQFETRTGRALRVLRP